MKRVVADGRRDRLLRVDPNAGKYFGPPVPPMKFCVRCNAYEMVHVISSVPHCTECKLCLRCPGYLPSRCRTRCGDGNTRSSCSGCGTLADTPPTCAVCLGTQADASGTHVVCCETGVVSRAPERHWDTNCAVCGDGLCPDHLTGTYEYYDDASDSRCTKCAGADA